LARAASARGGPQDGDERRDFSEIHLASRTVSKCDAIAESVKQRTGVSISTYAIDAEDVPALSALIEQIGPSWWSIWRCPIRI
jgi:saccharopine dehydrogenase-like NADP-dependent oxidoreductase